MIFVNIILSYRAEGVKGNRRILHITRKTKREDVLLPYSIYFSRITYAMLMHGAIVWSNELLHTSHSPAPSP